MQKFPAENFTATAKMTFHARFDGEETGLLIMGLDYQYISLKRENGELMVRIARCINAEKQTEEELLFAGKYNSPEIYLRVSVSPGAQCNFSMSNDGIRFIPTGPAFTAKQGKWIGAKVGFFALREGTINDAGTVNIDWFRIE